MKTFAGNKSLDTIIGQALLQGVSIDARKYLNEGSDHILFHSGPLGPSWHVLYNTFNGRFFGRAPNGELFTSDAVTHEGEPWFQALMSFFYVEQGGDAERS